MYFRPFRKSPLVLAGPRREEEAHQADVFGSADLRAREDLRADQVLGGAGTSQARLRAGHDGIAS